MNLCRNNNNNNIYKIIITIIITTIIIIKYGPQKQITWNQANPSDDHLKMSARVIHFFFCSSSENSGARVHQQHIFMSQKIKIFTKYNLKKVSRIGFMVFLHVIYNFIKCEYYNYII